MKILYFIVMTCAFVFGATACLSTQSFNDTSVVGLKSATDTQKTVNTYELNKVFTSDVRISDFFPINRDKIIIAESVLNDSGASELSVLAFTNGTWVKRSVVKSEYEINEIFFISSDVGWAVGNGGLLMSTEDGGLNWTRLTTPTTLPIDHIHFLNRDLGYLAASTELGAEIFRSQDGGNSWQRIYKNDASGHVFDLVSTDERTVIVAMNGEYLLRTTDGGSSWHTFVLKDGVAKNVDGITPNSLKGGGANSLTKQGGIWAVGEEMSIYHSEDGGLRWKEADLSSESSEKSALMSISVCSDGFGLILGNEGQIVLSIDQGKSWSKISYKQKNQDSSTSDLQEDRLLTVKYGSDKPFIAGRHSLFEFQTSTK